MAQADARLDADLGRGCQEGSRFAQARQAFLAEETNDLLRAALDAAVTDGSADETIEAMEALVRFNWVRAWH